MKDQKAKNGSRAFRGLALVFVLTFVNLIGAALAVTALGGLGEWTRWQFVGLFGVIETAAGISNIFAPNIWHLPAAELNTSGRTQVRLAASTMFFPHWGGATRAAAGVILILASGFHEVWSPASVLLLPFEAATVVFLLAVSATIARLGVAYPDTDTVQFILKWRSKDRELEPLSITASIQQFVLGILTLPAVKILAPGAMFGPELRPSTEALLLSIALAGVTVLTTVLLWTGRIQWRAPREQKREAEANA